MNNTLRLFFGALTAYSGLKSIGSALAGLEEERRPSRKQLAGAPVKATMYNPRTIEQRVALVRKKILKGKTDPEIIGRTRQLLSRKCGGEWCVPEKNWGAEVNAIFRWVRDNVRYIHDPHGVDTFGRPGLTVKWGGGDCDDYVIVLGSMLQAVGYPVRMRVIRTKDSSEWNHIYLLVQVPPTGSGKWIALDASVDRPPGWQAPRSMVAATKDFPV